MHTLMDHGNFENLHGFQKDSNIPANKSDMPATLQVKREKVG
jgi:hypothetical protein